MSMNWLVPIINLYSYRLLPSSSAIAFTTTLILKISLKNINQSGDRLLAEPLPDGIGGLDAALLGEVDDS
jgi:hypothetical protein